MSYGPSAKYVVTMASAGTLTSELDLGRVWKTVYLDPTGAASEVRIQAAFASGGTFRQVYHPSINSSTVGNNIFKIASATSGGVIEIPPGLRFIKIETTATVADGLTFSLFCAD